MENIILTNGALGVLVAVITELFKRVPAISGSTTKQRLIVMGLSILSVAAYAFYQGMYNGIDIVGAIVETLGGAFVTFEYLIKATNPGTINPLAIPVPTPTQTTTENK